MAEEKWIRVCGTEELEPEDVMRFDYGKHSFAVYRTEDGSYYATQGYCTHLNNVHLCEGLVMGDIIECPKHNGRFHIPTGGVKRKPPCRDLKIFPTKVEDGTVFMQTE